MGKLTPSAAEKYSWQINYEDLKVRTPVYLCLACTCMRVCVRVSVGLIGLRRALDVIGPVMCVCVYVAERVQMGDVLGKGGFGVVYKAQYKGFDVAVKTLLTEAMSVENYQGFLKEIEIMRSA